jgi:hypothetical protein
VERVNAPAPVCPLCLRKEKAWARTAHPGGVASEWLPLTVNLRIVDESADRARDQVGVVKRAIRHPHDIGDESDG